VNWCPQLGTVLANEEVKDGVSERGGYPVERKLMSQWSLRITAYADRLLKDLDGLDWSESIKEAQRNWIGKSEGSSLKFKVFGKDYEIEVFTTRPDTIFGVSFLTLAPEHELVNEITSAEQKEVVENYISYATNRSERERMSDVKKISGEFTGAFAIHPFTGDKIPVWIGDYVLAGYGTGAVMAVPAHDSRDFAFANFFNLPKPIVIQPQGNWDFSANSFDGKEGTLVNSSFLDGLDVKSALKKVIAEIEKKQLGKGKTNFRLRDAIFGRQRYWGEPIPIYYVDGVPHVLSENELPLVLPEVDKYLPTESGEPPLARAKNWKYKGVHDYEHSTMPGWAGSSWYYLRYMDARNDNEFASNDALNYWQDVDLYIGGSEHATGHLLYVRFWTKFLFDLGLISAKEPAKKLINQGMIQGVSSLVYRGMQSKKFYSYTKHKTIIDAQENGVAADSSKFEKLVALHVDVNIVSNNVLDQSAFKNWREEYQDSVFITEDNGDFICGSEVEKMSKSKWNVVSPDTMIEQYGADSLRLYEMFLGPLELSKPWNTNGITGVSNFLRKLWRLYHNKENNFEVSIEAATKEELKSLHKTIKKISEDIERFSFNTSVSNFMICVNELTDLKCHKREILEPLVLLVSPYAPHIAEELWQKLGHKESVCQATFPICNEDYLVESVFNYPISINGKTRFNHEFSLTLSKEELEKQVLALDQVQKLLEGKTPKKIILVIGKIVNLVV
jgi:leucyl-tRNA synthetase